MAINFRVSGNNQVSFSSEPAGNPGAIGIRNHDELSNRDLVDQHPINAITFLQEILEGLDGGKADNSDLVAESERAIDAEDALQEQIDSKADADDVEEIQSVIPAQASSQNKLADKNFVNSSIATNTAYFRGTFNSVAELQAYSGEKTPNDYAFVIIYDEVITTQVKAYDRYKLNEQLQWAYEFELNNSSFTAEQWAAITSGITSGLVALIGTAIQPSDIEDMVEDGSLTNEAYVDSAIEAALGSIESELGGI